METGLATDGAPDLETMPNVIAGLQSAASGHMLAEKQRPETNFLKKVDSIQTLGLAPPHGGRWISFLKGRREMGD